MLDAASSITRSNRPAVLLSCWAVVAKPEDPLATLQSGVARKMPICCIALVIPFSQERIICKGWALGPFFEPCTPWAACVVADALIRCCTPLVIAGITQPMNGLLALRNHSVRGTIILLIVPLSCSRRIFGSHGVVLAHFAAAALRTPTAIGPVTDRSQPAVWVAIWTLVTQPLYLFVAVWFDCYVA